MRTTNSSLRVWGMACGLFLSALTVAGAPTLTTHTWKSDGTGYSGSFDDPNHWNTAAVPDALSLAMLSVTGSDNPVISFPDGVYDTRASLRFNVTGSSGSSLTLNGSNTVLRLPSCAEANYGDEPFGFRRSNNHFLNFQTYSDPAAVRNKHAICVISNGFWRESVSKPSDRDCFRVDFFDGFYNFYDPEGTPYLTPYFILANISLAADVTVAFHPGTRTRMPSWQLSKNLLDGYSARLAFLGGEHEIFGTVAMPMNVHYSDGNSGDTIIDVTNNASLRIGGAVTVGCLVTAPGTYYINDKLYDGDNRYFFNVGAGGRLTFDNTLSQKTSGPLFLNAFGNGIIAFKELATIGGTQSTGTVAVAQGGRVEGKICLSGDGKSTLEVAAGGTADLDSLVIGANGPDVNLAIDPAATLRVADFRLARGELAIPEGGAWTNQAMYLGHSGGLGARLTVPQGTVCCAPGQLYTGYESGGATLDVMGGDVMAGNFKIANWYTSTGIVNVVSGTITATNQISSGCGCAIFNILGGKVSSAHSMYVPSSMTTRMENSYGTVNVSGGELVVKESLGIGHTMGGELNISGGEVTCMYIFLGQGNNANEPHGGTLRMTGGTFTTTCYDRTDTGVKVADAVNRSGHVILDGGEAHLTRLFGWAGARCRGGSGIATFSADGGTIITPSAVYDLILDFDTAELGAKGLTVKADYACPISQSFADKPGAEGTGLLTLAGSGVKTLSPTNSTVSRLAVAGGTVLFAPNTNGVQAVQDSSIVVTNNATLSLVGAQTSLTVRDLVLGDAVSTGNLALDATDVLRVTGTLTVNDAAVVVTGASEIGSIHNLIELTGDRADELTAAWARIRVSGDASAAGRLYTLKPVYDAGANKTYLTLEVASSATVPNAVNWQGPGANWGTGSNWEGGAVPTALGIACFASETVPSEVSVAQTSPVAGLTFAAAQGYVVTGAPLVVSALDASRVKATAGENVVASDLSFSDVLPVEVAAGAALTLGGHVRANGLTKVGAGRLALTNGVNSFADLTISNGTLAVAQPGTLGTVSTIAQVGGTLELGGAEGEETDYPQRVAMKATSIKTPLLIKTTEDVTMPMPAITSGLPYKHGEGRLTLTANVNAMLAVSEGGPGNWYFKDATVPLDADGNLPPDTVVAGFNVAEGEVVLRGTKPNVTLDARHCFAVGVPQPSATIPPALTLDNVSLNCLANSQHFHFGSGFTDSNVQVNDVYLTATNGSVLTCDTLYVGRGNRRQNMSFHVLFDKSSISCSYITHANVCSGIGSLADYTFRNGAAFYTPWLNVPFRSKFLFDAATLAKNASLTPLVLHYKMNETGTARSGADYIFRNGALFCCNSIEVYNACEKPNTLTFDNAEWRTGAADFTFAYPHPTQLKFYVANDGLILAPPAGGTWTMAHAVSGEGGIVKRGAGTLVFDTHKRINPSTLVVEPYADATTTLNFTGVAKVEEGMLKVKAGAARPDAGFDVAAGAVLDLDGGESHLGALSGAGTVQNGRLLGTIGVTVDGDGQVTDSALTFANVTFGRVYVDFGRTAANPIPMPVQEIVVGHYTGEAPNVSSWWVVNTGLEAAVGRFTAHDGNIYLTVGFRGLTINFR
ncbi:MAG: hypothetical protein MJ240_06315 [Kiritimatiellae bacterium]|nr:hypothetical protein [Kiritimatiellia bacterium]